MKDEEVMDKLDFLDWAHAQPEMEMLRKRFNEILERVRA